ncbi:hypothetical protein E2320_016158, partial [Naja naja]
MRSEGGLGVRKRRAQFQSPLSSTFVQWLDGLHPSVPAPVPCLPPLARCHSRAAPLRFQSTTLAKLKGESSRRGSLLQPLETGLPVSPSAPLKFKVIDRTVNMYLTPGVPFLTQHGWNETENLVLKHHQTRKEEGTAAPCPLIGSDKSSPSGST